MATFDPTSYAHAGDVGMRDPREGGDIAVRVFLSNEERSLIQVVAHGWDAEEAIAWAEDWAAEKYGDGTYGMDEYEAA